MRTTNDPKEAFCKLACLLNFLQISSKLLREKNAQQVKLFACLFVTLWSNTKKKNHSKTA